MHAIRLTAAAKGSDSSGRYVTVQRSVLCTTGTNAGSEDGAAAATAVPLAGAAGLSLAGFAGARAGVAARDAATRARLALGSSSSSSEATAAVARSCD